MYHPDNDLLLHVYSEDSVSFFELFVPPVIRVSVGEWEWILGTLAMTEDDHASLPVNNWVVAF